MEILRLRRIFDNFLWHRTDVSRNRSGSHATLRRLIDMVARLYYSSRFFGHFWLHRSDVLANQCKPVTVSKLFRLFENFWQLSSYVSRIRSAIDISWLCTHFRKYVRMNQYYVRNSQISYLRSLSATRCVRTAILRRPRLFANFW